MPEAKPTGAMLEAWDLYRRYLERYFSSVDLAGLTPDDEPLALRQIYVPLVLTPERRGDELAEDELHRGGRSLEKWLEETYAAGGAKGRMALPYGAGDWRETSWLPGRTLLLAGEAGSGKTTLVRSVVQAFIDVEAADLSSIFRDFVPFPIILREAPIRRLGSLDALVEWWLGEVEREEPGLESGPLRSYLDRGWGLLLLDGLDEVGDLEARERVLGWVERSSWTNGVSANLTAVTARPTGYEGLQGWSRSSIRAHVAPFSKEQIRDYLDRWFRLRPMPERSRDEVVGDLFGRLTSEQEAKRLRPMARRPAYLATLALVHGTRGELPHSRAALYELLIDAYVDMLDRQRRLKAQREQQELPIWDRKEKIEILSAVACQAHLGTAEGPEKGRRFVFSREELAKAVGSAIDYYGEVRFRTVKHADAAGLAEYFRARTGLLVEAREGRYQFGHLSLQEYLTAVFLVAEASATADKAAALSESLFSRLDQAGWQEVAVLALAVDSGRTGGAGHRTLLAQLDLHRAAHVDFLGLLLAGEELRFTDDERHDLVLAWAGGVAATGTVGALDGVVGQSANAAGIETAWRLAGRWLAGSREGVSFASRLAPALRQGEGATQPPAVRRNPLASLTRPASSQETSAARTLLGGFATEPDIRTAPLGAIEVLLLLPLLMGVEPDDANKVVGEVVHGLPVSWQADDVGLPEPPVGWWFLEPWGLTSRVLGVSLVERTPLAWALAQEGLVSACTGLGTGQPGGTLAEWKLKALRRTATAERWFEAAVLDAFLSGESSGNARTSSMDWTSSVLVGCLDLVSRRTFARAWARSISTDEPRSLATALARKRFFTTALDPAVSRVLARSRDLFVADGLNPGLDLDALLDLDLLRPRLGDAAPVPDVARRIVGQSNRLSFLFRSSSRQAVIADPVIVAVVGWIALTLEPAVDRVDLQPTRAEVEAELAAFRDPEIMAADLEDPDDRRRAAREWQQLLDSPLSPIPLLESVLELPGDRFDASTEAVLDAIDRALDEIEASVRKEP